MPGLDLNYSLAEEGTTRMEPAIEEAAGRHCPVHTAYAALSQKDKTLLIHSHSLKAKAQFSLTLK